MKLGSMPKVVCHYHAIKPVYGLHALYMPIKMAGGSQVHWPQTFDFLSHAIDACFAVTPTSDRYVYLSYECSYVKKGIPQKRPGMHTDGFMTEDVNFIWHDRDPTVFYDQEFNVTPDHAKCLEELEAQKIPGTEVMFYDRTMLMLDSQCVHRASIPQSSGIRTFFKLSVSTEKYNLKGNTHNPEFDYNWTMYDRALVRNHPATKEADFVKCP